MFLVISANIELVTTTFNLLFSDVFVVAHAPKIHIISNKHMSDVIFFIIELPLKYLYSQN